MITKTFGLILGTVILIVFGLVAFWPALMDGISSANATYNASSNYTGLNQAIRFTPLGLWVALLSLPAVGVVLIIWSRRQGVI